MNIKAESVGSYSEFNKLSLFVSILEHDDGLWLNTKLGKRLELTMLLDVGRSSSRREPSSCCFSCCSNMSLEIVSLRKSRNAMRALIHRF